MMKNKMMNMVKMTLASTMLFASLSVTASAAQPIKRVGTPDIQVLIDARKIKLTDAKPYANEDQRVMVPVRVVSEGLGAKVDWNQAENKVTITKDEKVVQLTANQKTAVVNGKTVQFDTNMTVKKQRVYVPLRFVSEALGQSVMWDSVSRWVWIGKQDVPRPEDVGIKNVPLEDVVKYFKNRQDIYEYHDKATIYKSSDFPISLPVKIGENVIYEVFQANQGSIEGIGLHYSGTILSNIHLVLEDYKGVRTRNPVYTEKHVDGTKTAYFPVVSESDSLFFNIKNYKDLKYSHLKYLGITTDSNSLQLLQLK
ncbi:copper amine oxidase N-terminal domain-containing protein [Marinicrinis lubricantis]|uniref:Copper amine oxidase N-terminal domain-containing protein n=1 Tax=Marinicrinis lubricantis TaxID=2086470 RepID=A0ABW1IPG1_9BACL